MFTRKKFGETTRVYCNDKYIGEYTRKRTKGVFYEILLPSMKTKLATSGQEAFELIKNTLDTT